MGTFAAKITEPLQHDKETDVFRAVVTSPEDASFRLQSVCKIGYGSAVELIEREAGYYQNQLKHLQGKYVSSVLGLFVGTTSRGPTAVLVVSDEGRQLKKELQHLPLQFRKRVFRGLRRIHQAGILQNDISEANVVVRRRKDGSYWPTIVDFDQAMEHECVLKEKVCIYGQMPVAGVDLCYELVEAGCPGFADLYAPRGIQFANSWIPAQSATDVDSVLGAASHIISASRMSDKDSRAVAEETVKNYREWYEERIKWTGRQSLLNDAIAYKPFQDVSRIPCSKLVIASQV